MICFANNTEPKNELLWCPSRIAQLERCPRRYFYTYIGSWGGWVESSSNEQSQHLYRLRYLTHPWHEVIRIVRRVIAEILGLAIVRARYASSDEIRSAVNRFQSYLARSAHLPLNEVSRKRTKLLNDELGRPLKPEMIDQWCQYLAGLLREFFSLEDTKDLLRSPSSLHPDSLRLNDFEIGYELGVPARLPVEAMWLGKRRNLVVGRWCPVPLNTHPEHALIRDIYIRLRLRLPDDYRVEHRFYYLESGRCETHTFGKEERESRRNRIAEEYSTLQRLSDDEQVNTAPSDRFPPRVTGRCNLCQFQTVCDAFKTSLSEDRLVGSSPKLSVQSEDRKTVQNLTDS